jgi:ankyrin repeat protein
LDKGADPNAKDDEGNTPYALATAKGYRQVADMLRARTTGAGAPGANPQAS